MKIETNLQPWPNDWYQHLLNSSELYFSGREISFLGGWVQGMYLCGWGQEPALMHVAGIELFFEYNDFLYTCSAMFESKDGCLYVALYDSNNGRFGQGAGDLCLTDIFFAITASPFACVKRIEDDIREDYKRRGDSGGDDGGDDEPEDAPENDPVNCLDLEPILA